ncbi:PRP1 splicing factor N-terminal domain-containing protein [[Candida] zeylanoides]
MERKAFLDQEAPAGYVAGVGRGAVGFTTSADTARAADSDDEGPVEEAGLLAGEDHEADRIYAEVEARLARRKAKEGSSGAVAAPGAATGAAAGAVADAAGATPFVNLKRALATVSDDQWANLPTVGDLTRRNKRTRLLEQQQQRFYAAPDTALAGTNFEVIADAKDKLLSQHLDGMAPAAPAAPAVDAASYDVAPEVADVAKSRLILASLRRSDPNNASAWIAAARLEEQDHKPAAARALATQGCRAVPRAPEVWLESIRLHQPQGTRQCQAICAEALKYNPQSEQLWLRAADLEHSADRVAQRKVLMRALEHVPSSAAIWRRLIEMEEEPQRLLAKAIELCPDEWSFWLSLINLSPYAEARALLNRARQTVRSPQVWVAAAKVEEREHASAAKVAAIVERGAAELDEPRHQWLELAVEAEREGFPMTCAAVVRTACESDPSDLLKLAAQYKQHPQTARAIFQVIIDADPSSLTSWLELLGSLRAQRAEVLYDYYEQALALNEEVIWLMYAKDLWKVAGDAERAAKVLERATAAFNTEQVWFARLKLAAYTARGLWIDAVMPLSRQMFTQLPASPAAWYKHIHHLRCWRLHHDTNESVLDLCDAALERFPECAKLHLQRAQVAPESATATLAVAVRSCPSDALWIAYAESVASAVRARAILDNALAQQSSARLWLHRIRFERRHSEAAARQLCARALKQFASDASLWVEHLHLMATPAQRRNAYLDALKSTNNAALVLMHIGLFFWTDGKLAKVGAWLQCALDANDRNGDCWAWMWVHLKAHGDDGERQHFLGRFKAVYEDINEGETWTRLAKSPARTAFANLTAFLDSVADALTNT